MENNDFQPDDLTQADVNQIAFEIREQIADPEDARRLLQQFCDLYALWGGDKFEADQARQFEILLRHLRDSFHNYLRGNRKTLEAAFGLKRGMGRPKADRETRIMLATEVLRMRLKNQNHQDALMEVAEKFNCSESVVGEAWAEYKQEAVISLRQERPQDAYPWTSEEAEKLNEIYKKLNETIASLLHR